MIQITLLGGFEVNQDGQIVTISSRPAQSLFAYLVLNPGTAHRREKLAGLLWPDSPEDTARDYLRHALWRIRKSFPSKAGFLIADDLAIQFDGSRDFRLDSDAVEQVSENASADELAGALVAYRGELLPGFYDEWVVLEREHLQSVFERKMARLLALLQCEGRWLEIIEWGERWISFGQRPEPAYRALMSAHAALGEMSRVAATYDRCEKALRELDMSPSEQTAELYARLRSGVDVPRRMVGLSGREGAGKDTSASRPRALNGVGFIDRFAVNPADRRPQLEEALAVEGNLGNTRNIATALFYLGIIAVGQGDYVEARARLEQSLELWQSMGPAGMQDAGRLLGFLGDVAVYQSDGGGIFQPQPGQKAAR